MKVISFSLWGTDRQFFEGALANVGLAKTVYPGWTTMFFMRTDCPLEWEMSLQLAGAVVIRLQETRGPWEGLFWRFAPISFSSVECTLSRDCDSRVNPREAAAVKDWLDSGELFHSMRDHFEHNVPIMGGMFGCRHWSEFGKLMEEKWTDYSCKGIDQKFLADVIWPLVRSKSVTHDRYAHGLQTPNRDGVGTYRYYPIEAFGLHELRMFPEHPAMDLAIYGAHVGAKV